VYIAVFCFSFINIPLNTYRMKANLFKLLFFPFLLFTVDSLSGQETIIQYLSGSGNDHTVDWQFFCTDGRNSGKWTTIPVPSNWELQGFGKYNYGHDKDSLRGKEKGLYKYKFMVPVSWDHKVVNLVFDGSMTDTEVKINGKSAGSIHQGSFYRFKYDITSLLKFGKSNLLEVTVSKHSSNPSVNGAERKCDFWIFGGIFRPVYLEALPQQHIKSFAIDAKANGSFISELTLQNIDKPLELSAQIFTLDGKKVGDAFGVLISKGDTIVRLHTTINHALTWTPESPNLYSVTYNLSEKGKSIHSVSKRFGFRTVEFRERDGIYVNGTRIKFKGVNRHSFWPSSGRTTSKNLSIADVELMKDMNMNAVRMSHYPPDDHFLDVCDSLGLFVLDELTGWHNSYDTKVGTPLVKEMVSRDVNHPSVVIWDNGNEGGHNLDFDAIFDQADIQKRPVVHPWQNFRSIDAQHYRDYDYGNGTYFHGHDVFFPTEFLHGIYDGGLGAGLKDYWEAMWNNPLSVGGFLWVFCDEGVVRTDKNGTIDTDGSHAPDGILGPYREKEGSYYAIKEVWAPIKFEHREITSAFDGSFPIENRFFFTNTNQCRFAWKLAKMPEPFAKTERSELSGKIESPDIQPGSKGQLKLSLPTNWQAFDVLYVTSFDSFNKEIYTWSWPITLPDKMADKVVDSPVSAQVSIKESDTLFVVAANKIQVILNRKNGLLQQVSNNNGIISLNKGPVLCEGKNDFKEYTYQLEGDNLVLNGTFEKTSNFVELKWTFFPTGWVKLNVSYFPTGEESETMGISFSYPEKLVKSVTWMGDGPYRVWKNRMEGTSLDVWNKDYNNTVTGESAKLIYPEFKGYYSNLYWVKVFTTEQPFTVVAANEDIFLRLLTPQSPQQPFNTAPAFPSGDISFLHGISPVGTKGQKPINLGPSGKKNMYFDYWKARTKNMTLYFDFSGK
jgi:hypothetical protein